MWSRKQKRTKDRREEKKEKRKKKNKAEQEGKTKMERGKKDKSKRKVDRGGEDKREDTSTVSRSIVWPRGEGRGANPERFLPLAFFFSTRINSVHSFLLQ